MALRPIMGSASAPVVRTLAVATPPEGLFRVLTRLNNRAGRHLNVGVGYSYGGITADPNGVSDYTTLGTGTGYKILDIGALTIPPISTPEGGTVGTFTIRFGYFMSTVGGTLDLDADWLMLMPANQGFGYLTKANAADRILSDSRSGLKGFYVTTTGDAISLFPANQVGFPPEVHPRGARYYFVGSSSASTANIDNGWTVQITYVPRYIHVG